MNGSLDHDKALRTAFIQGFLSGFSLGSAITGLVWIVTTLLIGMAIR